MNICEIDHLKNKKSYEILIMPRLMKAFDNNDKYFNDKFKSILSLICRSLKTLWISIYIGSHETIVILII